MTHAERARLLRDSAKSQVEALFSQAKIAEEITADATAASATAQIATVDALLAVVEELREGRRQDAREARKEHRRA